MALDCGSRSVGWLCVTPCFAGTAQKESLQSGSGQPPHAWAEWKRGGMTEYAYRAHPRRSALSDALGGGHDNILPQIECRSLRAGDRLLLCTDGIIDGLWEKGLAAELSSPSEAKECSLQILRRARENSSGDDATMIVADIAEL